MPGGGFGGGQGRGGAVAQHEAAHREPQRGGLQPERGGVGERVQPDTAARGDDAEQAAVLLDQLDQSALPQRGEDLVDGAGHVHGRRGRGGAPGAAADGVL
ncbi:hypothetical protein ACFQY4_27335 [Catellatospora bangladeshensis]|uniref:hypothetical protein n=1 Tax=Catellatospora bangladeshensis TaxID=310355 RepID=UPI003623C729